MKENNDIGFPGEEMDRINVINTGSKSRVVSKKKNKQLSVAAKAALFGSALFVIMIAVGLLTVFRVTEIEIVGCEYYSEEDILNEIGLELGDSIFLANEKKYASLMSGKFPMVYSVKVEKKYPTSVRIKITEEAPSYRFEYADRHAVVSHNGKVLYLGDELPEEFEKVLKAKVPEVSEAVAGYVIKYRDAVDKEAVEEVVVALQKSGLGDKIEYIEMKSRFDIKARYDDRFTILFGDRTDLGVKLRFVEGIVETQKNGEKGTINVKSAKKGYLILE